MDELPQAPVSRDRLTIARLMVLMAGVGLGLTLFRERESFVWHDLEWWRETATAVLIGCSLPGVLYTTRWRRAIAPLGLGSLLWLTLSLGALLMVPPVIAAAVSQRNQLGTDSAGMCLYYCMPLVSLWFVLAALLSGGVEPRASPADQAWGDWFGWRLGLVWSCFGVWLLFDFYRDAFFG